MSRTVHVVPHTHWDREWYKPYPLFRMQLVELIDGLLPQLEGDDSYAHFQLDGQLAVIDDYLEIRPHEAGRIRRLNEAGRLSFGPWYTLPDEFLVSGETLVRDIHLGLRKAAEHGGSMRVGYLPDMFGHVAQMPQILRGFGLADAVVWRGVPASIDAPAFDWIAPDGSSVRAEFLSDGYSNGARLPDDGAGLIEMVEAFRAAQGARVGDDVLWMNGTDHQLPSPRLGGVIADANEQGGDCYVVTSLAEYLATAPREDLPTWHGELRSGATSNLLMGVASCRVDVKQAAAKAERWLERVAEPLAACWMPAAEWPGAFLDHAWRDVIRNAAHDSICGCSHDEVNDAVLHRYAESTDVAEALAERAMVRVLAASQQAAVAANPTARERAGLVSAVVTGDVPPAHAQQLSVRPQRFRAETVDRRAAVPVVLRAAMEDPRVSTCRIEEAADGSTDVVAVMVADKTPKSLDATALRERLEALAADDPDGLVHLEYERTSATQEIIFRTPPVPGFGWRGLAPADLGPHAVRTEGHGLTNGLVTVVADPSDGTFSIDGLAGFGHLVDDGDVGDTYNWCPPADDVVVDKPDHVDVTVREAGPVRGRIEIVRRYTWPTEVDGTGERIGHAEVAVTTLVELRAGEDLVRVSISFDNQSEDHRVRAWFPLPTPASTSEAECAFAIVERGLEAEGGPNELGLPTFPSRRFVRAGGLLVTHDGLCEYELVDVADRPSGRTAGSIAITLLRSVGIISQPPMATRALPAGPPTLTPGAQMRGRHHVDLVLHTGGRDPYAVADEAFTPLLTARFPGRNELGDPEASGQALAVSGAEVTALTRRDDGRLELRVVETEGKPAQVTVAGRTGERTDLEGTPTDDRFEGTIHLRPHEIATLALD
jgi:hypothetical protein